MANLKVKKVLIAYFSVSGTTEKMAEYIAEGVRFSGQEVVTRKIAEIRNSEELAGYDGYIFGSPTYSLDLPEPMKKFLLGLEKAKLKGELAGAFGPYAHDVGYRHDDYAPAIIANTLRDRVKMEPFELGPFNLKEDVVETSEGLKACHDFGRAFGEKLES
jgi:flavorubredoxin